MIDALLGGALLALVVIAGYTDLRTRRIPNALTLGGFVLALVLRALPGGEPLLPGVLGGLAAFALAVPLVLMGGLGGGDAKLLAAVGAFVGLPDLPVALLGTALAGGAMALVAVLRQGAFVETLHHCWRLVAWLPYAGRGVEAPPRTLNTPGAIAIPYGLAIGAGALAAWWA